MTKKNNATGGASDDTSMREQVYQLLIAALDGDENARNTLSSLLNFTNIGKNHPPSLSKAGNDSCAPVELAPVTLSRPHVRELHLRIKLNQTERNIWREIKVPSNLTLTALGEVLQDAMGWMHEHLFQFRKGDLYYVSKNEMEDSLDFGFSKILYKDMATCTVDDMLTEKGKRVIFEYDFGDSWEHDLWYKGEREYDPGEKPTITYVKGQGACPPEDCGGVWGYEELIKIGKKKRLTREDRERLEWYFMDGDYDPENLDPEEIVEAMESWTAELQNA